jgi:hypothetical protein
VTEEEGEERRLAALVAMAKAPTLGNIWADAFARPSKLWKPIRDWKPQEWTPLQTALGRAIGRSGVDLGCFDLQAHLAAGRITAALEHLCRTRNGTRKSTVLLRKQFWQPLQFRRGLGDFIRPAGDVMGWPVFTGGSWAFSLRSVDFDKHYPAAMPNAQTDNPTSRRKPGPKADWQPVATRELIRRGIENITAAELCEICRDITGYLPDVSGMNRFLKTLLKK